MWHGDHQTSSVRRGHDRLIRDLLLLCEEVVIDVQEDADDGEENMVHLHFSSESLSFSLNQTFTCKLLR